MAKFIVKVKVDYDVEIEATGNDEAAADVKVNEAIDEHLADIGGNYSGTKIEVIRSSRQILSFFNKSDEETSNSKKQNLNSYFAQLDKEEKDYLRDLILGQA